MRERIIDLISHHPEQKADVQASFTKSQLQNQSQGIVPTCDCLFGHLGCESHEVAQVWAQVLQAASLSSSLVLHGPLNTASSDSPSPELRLVSEPCRVWTQNKQTKRNPQNQLG